MSNETTSTSKTDAHDTYITFVELIGENERMSAALFDQWQIVFKNVGECDALTAIVAARHALDAARAQFIAARDAAHNAYIAELEGLSTPLASAVDSVTSDLFKR